MNGRSPEPIRRCLHLINGEHFSGAERVQDLLALSLEPYGYQVHFATLKEGTFAENRRSTCSIHHHPMRNRWDLGVVPGLVEVVRHQDIALLHAHTPRSLMVAAKLARRTGLPLVYHVHSPVGRDSTRWLQNRLNLWIEKWSLRRVPALIAVSDSIAQYMQSLGYGPQVVTVVPNGVPIVPDPRIAQLKQQSPGEARWQWTLGTVALFRPRKGTEVLLDAVAQMVAAGLNIGVLAVGGFESDDYQRSLRQQAKRLGLESRVEWTGFTRQVECHFPRMDLFVLPSLFGEGLPMVILEAMAMGCPVVASRVEGIEQALRDGIDGRIVVPGDAGALAQGIESLLSGKIDLQQMGLSAKQRQRDQFSDQSMCRGTAQVYDRLLERR